MSDKMGMDEYFFEVDVMIHIKFNFKILLFADLLTLPEVKKLMTFYLNSGMIMCLYCLCCCVCEGA